MIQELLAQAAKLEAEGSDSSEASQSDSECSAAGSSAAPSHGIVKLIYICANLLSLFASCCIVLQCLYTLMS